MLFWIVLAIIILIIIAFLCTKLKININYDNDLSVVLRVLFFKFKLYPEKTPKKSMSYKELKKFSKRIKNKEEKRKLKQAYKNKKKENTQKKKKKFSDIVELVKEISSLAMLIIDRLFDYLRIKVKYLDVVVATGDPATTAISYAVVCSTLNILIARIENSNMHYSFNNMECRCDYLAAKSSCKADIEFKIRIWQALYVSLYSLVKYLSTKNNDGGSINGKQNK